MSKTILKTLLCAAMLLVGGTNAWADATVQQFGDATSTSWTASSSTTNIKYGSTVTLKGVVMTFCGGDYADSTPDTWTWNAGNSGVLSNMPNTGTTSSGVTSVAVGNALPSHGGVYQFVLSAAGKLTINGKGGTEQGKYYLVQVDADSKITSVLSTETASNKEVTHTYALESGTYYYFQCAHAAANVTSYRYTLKSISFETLEPVAGLKVWDFEQSGWSTISTTAPVGVMQDQLWLSGSISYNTAQTRYELASATSNQIRFKVKKGQMGYVVIIAKGPDGSHGVMYGLGTKASVGQTAEIGKGSIYKTYTSTFVTCGEDKDVLIHANGSTTGYIKKIAWVPCNESGATLASVTLGTAGFSTFCPMATVTIPTGLKAYILNSCDGTTATWNEITGKIPAFAGVLLVGQGGYTYDFVCPSSSSSATDGVVATGPTTAWYNKDKTDDQKVQQNILVGTYQPTAIPASTDTKHYFGLVKNTATFGRVTSDVTIPAGMAYFSVSGSIDAGVREFVIDLGDEATGITSAADVQPAKHEYYNLSGQRVSRPAHGLYIVRSAKGRLQGKNGKKVVIK